MSSLNLTGIPVISPVINSSTVEVFDFGLEQSRQSGLNLSASNVWPVVHQNLSNLEILKDIITEQIEAQPETPILKKIHDILVFALLICVMFSMGCGVTVSEVINHMRRPSAVIVCIIAQFGLVPLIGYLIFTLLELEVLHATGLLILACCPGGVTSNIFTFMADGDLSLSITMTSVATIAALVLMPANVWLYGRNLETGSLVIPYMQMTVTLILVTIPVLLGMAVKYRYSSIAPYLTKFGSFAGLGIICVCQTLEIIIFPDIFKGVPARLYIAVILLPLVSFIAGFFFAQVCRLNEKICRTIGIEIGIKNVGTAITIVSLSFSLQQLKKAWVFPFLYAFSSFLVIGALIMLYRMAIKYWNREVVLSDKPFDANGNEKELQPVHERLINCEHVSHPRRNGNFN